MDLLQTILLYLTMVFVSSVQTAPDPSLVPVTPTPAPTTTLISVLSVSTAPATPTPTPVPTPNITPNDAYKTLKVGDRGDSVKQLQTRLAELGYFAGEVDGAFGNQTRRAVERFQYYQGLSVDGIAGKRTQTVLYESKEVVSAPAETTPAPTQTATIGPIAAVASTPATVTPLPTFVPLPTSTPAESGAKDAGTQTLSASETPAGSTVTPAMTGADATVAATAAKDDVITAATPGATAVAATPTLLEAQDFVLAGQTEPLTLQKQPAEEATAEPPATLRPMQVGDVIYAPFLAILKDAGSILLPGTDTARTEVAFSFGNDVFQISYVSAEDSNVTDLQVLKNQQPQLLSLRNAVVMDGTLYLPINVISEVTGTGFSLDEATGRYTVTLPVQ